MKPPVPVKPPSPWRIRLSSYAIGLAVFALAFATYYLHPKLLDDLEGRLLDARFLLRGDQPTTGQVAIVAVDDRSLTALGRWPWPRAQIAELIRKVHDAGAAVVGLDMVFSEPETEQTEAQLAPVYRADPSLGAAIHQALQHHSGDQLLANTLRATGNVVNGQFFFTSPAMAPARSEAELKAIDRLLASSAVELVRTARPDFPAVQAYGVTPNIPVIAKAGPGAGYFNFPPGRDGLIRHAPLVMRYRDRLYPALALKTLAHLLQVPIMVEVADYGIRDIRLGAHRIHTDELGAVTLNYRGPAGTIPTWSAADVLAGRAGAAALAGKIILLGVTAVGVYDAHSTSFGPSFPGLEIQATLMENLLADDGLQRTNLEQLTDVLTMALLVGLLAVVFPLLGKLWWQSAFAFALIGAYLAGNYWLFAHDNLWVVMIYPLGAWLGAYIALVLYFGLAVERRFSTVRTAFKSYLHPTLVERLTHQPQLLQFGGETKELTVLFSDLRDFTSKSERLTPEELSHFLKCYMDPMTDLVFQNRGTLDKYIGDAIMAFYGAPFPSAVHPQRACRTALHMLHVLDKIFLPHPQLAHVLPVNIGIGIHTGPAIVGNFGSTYRFSYTALGDTVNLGSRLESLSKRYGAQVVISETTYERVKEEFLCRELDRVRVKGKSEPIAIYQLLDERGVYQGRNAHGEIGTMDPDDPYLTDWAAALASYHRRDWSQALTQFEALAEYCPTDRAVLLYLDRCAEYLVRPPGEDWDGVFTYTEK